MAELAEQLATPKATERRWKWLLLSVVLLLIQSLPFFSYRWVTDESWYTGPGFSIAQGHGVMDPAIGPNDLENHFDARPPGTATVISGVFRMFGVGPSQARLGSLIAAILALLAAGFLAYEYLGEWGAVATVLVLATDNFLVASARTARPEALTTMAVMLSLVAMARYSRGEARIGWAFLSGLLMALAAMFHITVLGFVVSFGLLAIVLDIRLKRFPFRGAASYSIGFLLGLIPFAIWILTNPLGKQGFRMEYLARVHETLTMKLIHEGKRYSDMLGVHQLHGGFAWVPVRLFIPACFLVALVLVYRFRRRWLWTELLLLVPTLLWFIETANKSSRYFALAAPFVALSIGSCVALSQAQMKLRKLVVPAAVLLVLMQLGSNLLLLKAASHANYDKVGQELEGVMPTGEPIYGTITFWLVLRNHPYFSYERTTPKMAEQQYGVRYFVLGDRMMTQGEPWDAAFYSDMNSYLADLRIRSTLVGSFSDPYYGDLKVYRTR